MRKCPTKNPFFYVSNIYLYLYSISNFSSRYFFFRYVNHEGLNTFMSNWQFSASIYLQSLKGEITIFDLLGVPHTGKFNHIGPRKFRRSQFIYESNFPDAHDVSLSLSCPLISTLHHIPAATTFHHMLDIHQFK